VDRKKALEILGLPDDATPETIQKRTDVFYRKFKHIERDERGYTLLEIEDAYKYLMGITYQDKETEKRKKIKKDHPGLLMRLFNIDDEKVSNFLYYYKWHILIACIGIIALVSFFASMGNRIKPDLKIIISGDLYITDIDLNNLKKRIENETQSVNGVQIQNVYLSEEAGSNIQAAMQAKYVVELSAGQNDVFITDKEQYFDMAKRGAFKPISDYIEVSGFGLKEKDFEHLKVAVEKEDGSMDKPVLYGLDVSQNAMLKEAGIVGNEFIIALGSTGEHTENAVAFIKKILEYQL
jgi:hypothetical protein